MINYIDWFSNFSLFLKSSNLVMRYFSFFTAEDFISDWPVIYFLAMSLSGLHKGCACLTQIVGMFLLSLFAEIISVRSLPSQEQFLESVSFLSPLPGSGWHVPWGHQGFSRTRGHLNVGARPPQDFPTWSGPAHAVPQGGVRGQHPGDTDGRVALALL